MFAWKADGGARYLGVVVLGVLVLISAPSAADDFERLEGDQIAKLVASSKSQRHERISSRQLMAQPQALADSRTALLLVKTNRGNLARVLVEFGFRKSPAKDTAPLPVFVLERFATFEPGRGASRLAQGRGVLLFDGFQIDLDEGVIVPPGQGGDLGFRVPTDAKDPAESGQLEALAGAALFTLDGPLRLDTAKGGPSPGKNVVAQDFAGRYRLFADGRWTGTLDLTVDDARVIAGIFRSEPNGTSYPIRGQVAADPANKATFTIKFPRTEQEYDVFLWSEGKSALAGTFVMLGRTFGAYAVREPLATAPAR